MRLQQSPAAPVRFASVELHKFSSVAELHNRSGIAGNCRVLIIDMRRTLFNGAVLASTVKYPNVHRRCPIAKGNGKRCNQNVGQSAQNDILKEQNSDSRFSSWMSRGLRLEVYCGSFSGGSTQRWQL
jgi:hypothetical protein